MVLAGMHLSMRCCLAGWRSQRLSCEELIGADETNPSRGPRPPESKKNGRAVLLTGASSRFWQSRQNTVKPNFDATAAFESDQVTGICC
jgi:hypothetical protein